MHCWSARSPPFARSPPSSDSVALRSQRAQHETIAERRDQSSDRRELLDLRNTDLLAVALEARDDRLGNGSGCELRHGDTAYLPGGDEWRQHLEDADPARLQLRAEGAGEGMHGGLRGRIDGVSGDRGERHCGRADENA